MLTRSRKPFELPYSEITPQKLYKNRREFLVAAGMTGAALAGGSILKQLVDPSLTALAGSKLDFKKSNLSTTGETITSKKDATTYNNFYEFGTGKEDPSENAGNFHPTMWRIVVGGQCKKSRAFTLDEIMNLAPLEERVYRMRCVEGWSMVIPWIGIPLSTILNLVEPTERAKFVAFETLFDPKSFPEQRSRVLDWPYVEGLRLDEAMNPLAILALGMYGETLPGQNGAPVRLVTPWKYGFKGIKSIVKINLVSAMPPTTWNSLASNEYGFYSNVNPNVDHPRWSQAKERRIGEFLKRNTLMFNGYGDQVAKLYTGMDLAKNF